MFLYKYGGMIITMSIFAAYGFAGQQSTSDTPHVTVAPGPLVTFAEELKKHHIALTRDSLVVALQNSDPEVRSLAAAELAEERLVDTIPAISLALENEDVPDTKMNLASALVQLGDQSGIETLKEGCSGPANSRSTKMLATRYLLDLGSKYCLGAELEALQGQSDPENRIQALAFITKFTGISPDVTRKLVDLAIQALRDQRAGIGIYAGQALARLGSRKAIPDIERAIAQEKDDGARSELKLDLQQLQKRKPGS